jgi:hypothetical protein
MFLVALAVAIAADILTYLAGARYHSYTRFLLACLGVLDALRGLTVFVDSPDTTIDFRLV